MAAIVKEKCHKNNEECIENIDDVEYKAAVHNPRAHLVPRPSEDEGDPLNWPIGLKVLILFQVCWLAFVSMMEVFPSMLIYRQGLIAVGPSWEHGIRPRLIRRMHS